MTGVSQVSAVPMAKIATAFKLVSPKPAKGTTIWTEFKENLHLPGSHICQPVTAGLSHCRAEQLALCDSDSDSDDSDSWLKLEKQSSADLNYQADSEKLTWKLATCKVQPSCT